jgi:preprotein translocase subunit SecY
MIIFINIVGGIPANLGNLGDSLNNDPNANGVLLIAIAYAIYLVILSLIVLVQNSYKRINIVSARQLSSGQNLDGKELKNSYIPIKLNQGGIMPLVFSTTIATFLFYPLQLALTGGLSLEGNQLTNILTFSSFALNIVLVVFFSSFYALLVLKPKDLSENLTKMAYSVPGLKQGKDTTQYFEQVISRLAFMGGVFLAFLAFFPFVLGKVFQFKLFSNLTSLIILIGVITDVSSQIRGYLVSQNYESFKNS